MSTSIIDFILYYFVGEPQERQFSILQQHLSIMNETGNEKYEDQGNQNTFVSKHCISFSIKSLRNRNFWEFFLRSIEDNEDAYTVNPIVLDATTTESYTQPPLAEEKIPSGIYYCWKIELTYIYKSQWKIVNNVTWLVELDL